MDDQEVSNWEICKENVQPLRHGRRMANLTTALQHGSTVEQVLKAQRQAFETELRSYNGNDPLEVYLRYIQWTEQNFPSGGSSGHLKELLENAVEQFNNDDRYKSDPRFLDVWLRLIATVRDPLELFLYLYTHNSFTKLSHFYAEWAFEYEKLGNMQKADEVFNKGLENHAEPLEILQKRYNDFQVRTMRRVMQGPADAPQEDDRHVLGTLRTYGSRHTVPVERSRGASSGPTLQQPAWPQPSSASDRHASGNKKLTVFCDDSRPSALPPQTADRAKIPSRSDNTENEMKAGKWTEAKVKPTSKTLGVSKPQFEIHEDADSAQNAVTPAKTAQIFNALSAKKLDEQPTNGLRLLKDDANSKEKLMFNRHLLYAGTEEFSFEEIRAVIYSRRAKPNVCPTVEQVTVNSILSLPSDVDVKSSGSLHSSIINPPACINYLSTCAESAVPASRPVSRDSASVDQQQLPVSSSSTAAHPFTTSAKRYQAKPTEGVFMCVEDVYMRSNPGVTIEELRATWYEARKKTSTGAGQQLATANRCSPILSTSVTEAAAKKSLQFATSANEIAASHQSEASPLPHNVRTLNTLSTAETAVYEKNTSVSPALSTISSHSTVSTNVQQVKQSSEVRNPADSGTGGATPVNYSDNSCLSSQLNAGTAAMLPSAPAHSAGSYAVYNDSDSRSATNTVATTSAGSSVGQLSASGCQLSESHMKRVSSASSLLTNTSAHTSQGHRDTSESADCTRDLLHAHATNKSINVAQSVTMHTVEASNAVLAMFNKTLDFGHKQPLSNSGASEGEHDVYDTASAVHRAPAAEFMIYEDDCPPATSAPLISAPIREFATALASSSAPFTVFEDNPGPTAHKPFAVFEDPEPLPAASRSQSHALGQSTQAVPLNDFEIEDIEMQCDDVVAEFKPDLDFPEFDETIRGFNPSLDSTHCHHPSMASTPFIPSLPPPAPVSSSSSQSTATGFTFSASNTEELKSRRRSSTYMYNLSPITERSEQYVSSSGSSGESTTATTRHLSGATMSSTLFGKTPHLQRQRTDGAPSAQRVSHSSSSSNSMAFRNLSAKDPLPNNGLGINSNVGGQQSVCTSALQFPSSAHPAQAAEASCSKGHHEIDITTYISTTDCNVEQQLNASVWIDTRNPFDEELIAKFLRKLPQPVTSYPTYKALSGTITLRINSKVMLGDKQYQVLRLLGQGANARAYLLQNTADNSQLVAKVQAPPCPWEFYITCELQTRLANSCFVNLRNAVMTVEEGFFFADSSILLNKFYPYGSLLELSNAIKTITATAVKAEILQVLLTIEMMRIVEGIHQCQIIHGDFKPDNLLVQDIPTVEDYSDLTQMVHDLPLMLKLIDWGQAIDLRCFPANTTFTAKVTTSGFQCVEMMTNRPWTYQADLFGLVGSIHVLFFNKYMKVFQEQGRWRITSSFGRALKSAPILSQLFDAMLNINSCDDIPPLKTFREQLEQWLVQKTNPDMLQELLNQLREFLRR